VLATLGHGDSVAPVARRLVSASVGVWDIKSGRELASQAVKGVAEVPAEKGR
jgi:hypothetical protein